MRVQVPAERSQFQADRLLPFQLVDIDHAGIVENGKMNRLMILGGEFLHDRPRFTAQLRGGEQRLAESDQTPAEPVTSCGGFAQQSYLRKGSQKVVGTRFGQVKLFSHFPHAPFRVFLIIECEHLARLFNRLKHIKISNSDNSDIGDLSI